MARDSPTSRPLSGRALDLTHFSIRDMAECGAALRTLGQRATDLPAAMQEIAHYLAHRFRAPGSTESQCVLVRGFATRPFSQLDATERALAEEVLGRAPRSLGMKCLSLMGSSGLLPAWNDRTNSRRYRAIPLISEQFVGQFPMFSQLLKQFGVKIQPTLRPDSDLLVDWEERTHNVFYVPDAVDSPFVPVQRDFVVKYGVHSVLGFGGVLPSRELFAFILFSKARIPAATADHFRTLALAVKLALIPHDLREGEAGNAPSPTASPTTSHSARGAVSVSGQATKSTDPLARQREVEVGTLEQLLSVHERTVIADVIQRDLAEARLDRLRRDYEMLLNSAKDGIYGLDREGNLTFINPAGAAMLCWKPEDLVGRPMHALIHYCRENGTPYPTDLCPTHWTLQDGTVHSTEDEVYWRSDGTSFPVEYSSTPIREDGEIVGAVVTFRDITERHVAQAQLRDTLERLRIHSHRVQSVREEERARIARELHDELGVAMTCLKMDLSRVQSLIGGEQVSADRKVVEEKLQRMTEQVDGTLTSIQRIVAELRPGVLDDLGLVAAVEWQCRDFERRTGITCHCEAEDDIPVEPARATAIFRICQEALTNVMRHAEATDVSVQLHDTDGRIRLTVRDNGKGIPPEKLRDASSFGLMGMQERVREFQGTLSIDSKPGAGTVIEVNVGAQA